MNLGDFFYGPIFQFIIVVAAVIGLLTYAIAIWIRSSESFKRRIMENKIENLRDHYIICGFGRVGRKVAEEFAAEKELFVIIDREDILEIPRKNGWLYIHGDAAKDDDILKKAQIERAKGIIIAVGNDADSVFIAVSARALNPKIFIVARASSEEASEKLKQLGVDRVALPYQIGGYHMATMALRPSVVDFLDVVVDSKHNELQIEEMQVDKNSKLIGHPLAAYLSRKKTGLAVLAIRRQGGENVLNPTGDTIIQAGDELILMGTRANLQDADKEIL